MNRFPARVWRFLIHPISLIVVVQSAWTLTLVLWIYFFVRRYRQLSMLASSTGVRVQDLVSWASLVVGIGLLALIFSGTLAIIIWLMRQFLINRQMRNFLSFVSHELRTPITSIRLTLETLRDRSLKEEQRDEFIDNMLQDTDRLSQQIAIILDASRLERRRLPMRPEAVDLDRLVAQYREKRIAAPNGGGHVLELGETQPSVVWADRELLQTVLDNLIDNAERYSPPGTTITLSVQISGKWVLLQVRDRGIGVDPKERRKIFKLFYRGATAPGVARRGSGLGLFLVKGIVTLHRGKVDVLSEGPGRGSTFRVWLPRFAPKRRERP
ncbi:MAG: HAMP domain-containing histidine kinase [Myxococcales bacterium]|nr:HAMP domain-containing histidine kinase [Myxococcales bacterium]